MLQIAIKQFLTSAGVMDNNAEIDSHWIIGKTYRRKMTVNFFKH